MDKSHGDGPPDTVYSVEDSIRVQGENQQEEEDLEDRRRREAELQNILSARLGNISFDDEHSLNSTSFDSTSTSRYQSNPAGDAYKDTSLNGFEQLQVLYEARVNEQKGLRKTIDEMKVQHKADSDEITRKIYILEADFNRVQFLYQQAQEVLAEKNLELTQKETNMAELTLIVTDLTATRDQLQEELSGWKQTHAELQQKLQLMEKGLNKQVSEKQIRSHYEQELSKLQDSILVVTRKYESAETEIKALKDRIVDLDENEKQMICQIKDHEQALFCVNCTDLLSEIFKLENQMGVNKGVKETELTPGDRITHDIYEAILKQYLNSLRKVYQIVHDPEEVRELQGEVKELTQSVANLKSLYVGTQSNEEIKSMIKQKDSDIEDMKDIIVKLQAEKETMSNDMRDTILSLKEKEGEVMELTEILQKINAIAEKEKLQLEQADEKNILDLLIEQTLEYIQYQQQLIIKLKDMEGNDYVMQFDDINLTTKELHVLDQEFKNQLTAMSEEEERNEKLEAFMKAVSKLNQSRTNLEQELVTQLATNIERNVTKDYEAKQLSDVVEELSEGNEKLQKILSDKLQEESEWKKVKDMELLYVQQQLEKVTQEKIEAQNIITAKDEEIKKLKEKKEQEHVTLVKMHNLANAATPEVYELAEQFNEHYNLQVLNDKEEIKRLSDLHNQKSHEISHLRKKLRFAEAKAKRALSQNAEEKTENQQVGAHSNETKTNGRISGEEHLEPKQKLSKVNQRRVEHFEEEILRLQEKNANLNSELCAAQIKIIVMSERIENFESQCELIEDMKKKSHIFQEYMNEQITLRLTQPPANAVVMVNTATNTSHHPDQSTDGSNEAQRLELLNNILETKNVKYQILFEENKCLKEKIAFDRSALNDLTAACREEIDRLTILSDTTIAKNKELIKHIKELARNLKDCLKQFVCVSNKLNCANEVIHKFQELVGQDPAPNFHVLLESAVAFLNVLKNQVSQCLQNNR